MTRTCVDSGVLIAAATGRHPVVQPIAVAILDDPKRHFVSSVFVRLEVLPKAIYHRRPEEVTFYDQFFDSATAWAEPNEAFVSQAFQEAVCSGLSALDALHIAAAVALDAIEFITTERTGEPLLQTRSIGVVSIHPTVLGQGPR